MQVLTKDNVPKIGQVVRAKDYLGNVHEGEIVGRDWAFDRLMLIELGIFNAEGFVGRNVTIWAGRDEFELI